MLSISKPKETKALIVSRPVRPAAAPEAACCAAPSVGVSPEAPIGGLACNAGLSHHRWNLPSFYDSLPVRDAQGEWLVDDFALRQCQLWLGDALIGDFGPVEEEDCQVG